MSSDKQDTPSTFLEVVDEDTRASVLKLNQKLAKLKVEINTKLEALNDDDAASASQKEQLSTLVSEVEKALEGINDLTTMVVSDEMTNDEFLKTNQDELENFREMLEANARKITKISENTDD